MSFSSLVENHRTLVCVGSGGVGKTTTAAALALHGAMTGRRSMVLTIDPARRLAQSLGVDSLGSDGERIAPEVLAAAGVDVRGTLSAGMLDQKSAWDEFIARHAPSAEARNTILSNEFYQHLSRSFAGSTEYMAIEELCRIHESGLYDLIVLDTPPTTHALVFLEAPRRLEDFMDRSIVGWLVKPYLSVGWSAWKTASRTVRFVVTRIEEAAGARTLAQISEFFVAMETLFDGITERGRKVRGLLAGPDTAFILVAGPEEQVLGESEHLTTKMSELGMPLRGVVMNRIHPLPGAADLGVSFEELCELLVSECPALGEMEGSVVEWLASTYMDGCTVARAEDVRREVFEAGLPGDVVLAVVPEFERDVHEIRALARVAWQICGAAGEGKVEGPVGRVD
ncbi:MAG: ArsA family ATPase [Myxococcales bacterium]|nr:MAG: ArsA family ATPase [Myxococcales bacterium]